MALKYTPQDVQSGLQSEATLDQNFTDIQTALQDGLSRSGQAPNAMAADLDMNSNRILNLPQATSNSEPATYGQLLSSATTKEFAGYVVQEITATAGQTVFTLANSYTPGISALRIYINGIYQSPSSYSETSSTTVTFSEGLQSGDVATFVLSSFSSASSTSSQNITYTPPSATGIATNVQTKLRETISVKDFGAVGDGSTNDASAIQSALNYVASVGGTLIFPDGTYLCNTALSLTSSDVTLLGHGTATLDFSNVTATGVGGDGQPSNVVLCFNIRGTGRGTSSALTADATSGAYTVSVADGSSFAAGGWVQLTSTSVYPFAASPIPRAETHRVRSVSGNTISLVNGVYDYEVGYLTTDSASLYNVSYIENIHIDNIRFVGANNAGLIQQGVRLNWVKDFSITNCRFEGFDYQALNVANSIIGTVDSNYFYGTFYDGTGSGVSYYAITIYHNTQWVDFTRNKGERVRHLVTTSGTTTDRGEPHFCTISHNKIWDAMSGGNGRSYGFENHGFGRWLEWSSNIVDSAFSLINIERSDNTVINNIGLNLASSGIIIGVTGSSGMASGGVVRNILVSNNYINGLTDERDGSSNRAGILTTGTTNARYENITITRNTIHNFVSSNGPHYGTRIQTSVSGSNGILIDGNVYSLSSLGGTATDEVGIRIDTGIVGSIYRNRIHNYPTAILLSGDNQHACWNEITHDSVPTSSFAIRATSDNNVIRGNVISQSSTAIRLDSTATDAVVTDNTFINCSNTVSDGGTNTTTTAGNITL